MEILYNYEDDEYEAIEDEAESEVLEKKRYKIDGPPEKMRYIKYGIDGYGRKYKDMTEIEYNFLKAMGVKIEEWVAVP